LRVGDKQAREHGQNPVRSLGNILRFSSNLFPTIIAMTLIRGKLYHDWQD
jgi:hypothetical protein